MPIRTEAEARIDLDRHLGPLNGLFEAAHREFREHGRGLAPTINMTTRAMLYRDLIWKQARVYADEGRNGATVYRRGQLVLLGLENRYLLRVKKLRQGFAVATSPTIAAERFDANRLPEFASDLFPDCHHATLLYLAWTIPENAPDEIARYLVCNDTDRRFLWAIPLGEDGAGAGATEDELPMRGGDGEPPVRIRIKGARAKQANE